MYLPIYGKNNFAEVSKNLARYRSKNNFVGYQNNYQNINYIGHSNIIGMVTKSFDILAIGLSVFTIITMV